MVSRIQGTWFRRYRVHGFEGTGYMVLKVPGTGYGYMVSHYLSTSRRGC